MEETALPDVNSKTFNFLPVFSLITFSYNLLISLERAGDADRQHILMLMKMMS